MFPPHLRLDERDVGNPIPDSPSGCGWDTGANQVVAGRPVEMAVWQCALSPSATCRSVSSLSECRCWFSVGVSTRVQGSPLGVSACRRCRAGWRTWDAVGSSPPPSTVEGDQVAVGHVSLTQGRGRGVRLDPRGLRGEEEGKTRKGMLRKREYAGMCCSELW
jgi:hypothetical protein